MRLTHRIVVAPLLLAMAITLGACAHGTAGGSIFSGTNLSVQNPITNARLVDIEAAYGIALAAGKAYVDNYRKGNKCTRSNPESLQHLCSRRSIVLQIQAAVRKADIALANAKGFIQRNPTLDPTSVLDAAQTAVGTLQAINAQSGS